MKQIELYVDRYLSDKESTLGRLSVEGVFKCYTVEDQYQAVKVKKETRIPAGKYEVKLLTTGNHHLQYAKLFPEMHKGMLWLQDVPGFQSILIHIGNTEKDTDGCLLLGLGRNEEHMTVINSTGAYRLVYPLVADVLYEGGRAFITYTDNDKHEAV